MPYRNARPSRVVPLGPGRCSNILTVYSLRSGHRWSLPMGVLPGPQLVNPCESTSIRSIDTSSRSPGSAPLMNTGPPMGLPKAGVYDLLGEYGKRAAASSERTSPIPASSVSITKLSPCSTVSIGVFAANTYSRASCLLMVCIFGCLIGCWFVESAAALTRLILPWIDGSRSPEAYGARLSRPARSPSWLR